MKPSSAKAKGKLLEDYVADQIIAHGLDGRARRDGASGAGNREKGDIFTSMQILGQNAGIECKNQAPLAIPEWWRQTKKLEILQREPVLAFKQYGEGLPETKVVIYLETLLKLIALANAAEGIAAQPTDNSADNRRLKWALADLRNSASKVMHLLEVD